MDCMRNQFTDGALLGGRFRTIAPLNQGSFGMVFSAQDSVTGEMVAIKCLTKAGATNGCPSPVEFDDRSEELSIHTRIGSHANIVNLLTHFETDAHKYLVLEFCPNGDLYEAIRLNRGPLETEHVRAFMLQLVNAVEFMHSKGIFHRDIKPENIFLTQSGDVKLGDFGLATTEEWSYENSVGSDRYMAPEQYDSDGAGYSTVKADIWALGICLLNILFSRNPFAVPTASDPLYADFVADRQSLFDIFPTMSQDTYEVLSACLAIDPVYRSMSALKDALNRVVSFTTDDESLDEYCTADRDLVPGATTNREPLRTPSISSPQLDNKGSFPWAEALRKSPQKPVCTLPSIPDADTFVSEDLFPMSEQTESDWCSVKPDSASLASVVDSGLGVSIKSTAKAPANETDEFTFARSKPMPISGSLPAPIGRGNGFSALSSIFSKKNEGAISKSWSDMWDEDVEETAPHPFTVSSFDISTPVLEAEETIRPSLTAELKQRSLSHCSESTGRATPRAPYGDIRSPYKARNVRSPASGSSKFAGSNAEEDPHRGHGTRYASPTKGSVMDKWVALGERRRAETLDGTRSRSGPDHGRELRSIQSPTSPVRKTRAYVNDWRRNIPFRGLKDNIQSEVKRGLPSYMTKEWRKAGSTASSGSTTPTPSPYGGFERKRNEGKKLGWQFTRTWTPMLHDDAATPPSVLGTNGNSKGHNTPTTTGFLNSNTKANQNDLDGDDIGDLEWVGGWDSLHL